MCQLYTGETFTVPNPFISYLYISSSLSLSHTHTERERERERDREKEETGAKYIIHPIEKTVYEM